MVVVVDVEVVVVVELVDVVVVDEVVVDEVVVDNGIVVDGAVLDAVGGLLDVSVGDVVGESVVVDGDVVDGDIDPGGCVPGFSSNPGGQLCAPAYPVDGWPKSEHDTTSAASTARTNLRSTNAVAASALRASPSAGNSQLVPVWGSSIGAHQLGGERSTLQQ